MNGFPNVHALAPDFVERAIGAVDALDGTAMDVVDATARGLIATAVTASDPGVVLTELSQLYRFLVARCVERRAELKLALDAQRRAHAGASAYRATGAQRAGIPAVPAPSSR